MRQRRHRLRLYILLLCVLVVFQVLTIFYLFFNLDRLQQTPDVSGDVRNLVASLYRTINLHQFYAIQHRQLRAQQTELLLKLEPLEKVGIFQYN